MSLTVRLKYAIYLYLSIYLFVRYGPPYLVSSDSPVGLAVEVRPRVDVAYGAFDISNLSMHLSIYLSIHLSIYLSVYLSVCLCVCDGPPYLVGGHPPVGIAVEVRPRVHVSNGTFAIHYLSVYLSTYLSSYLSFFLFVRYGPIHLVGGDSPVWIAVEVCPRLHVTYGACTVIELRVAVRVRLNLQPLKE